MLKMFVIERELPGVGAFGKSQLGGAAATSNEALGRLAGIQWQHSYVMADGTYCIYLADDEEVIRRHAEMSGFPTTRVSEVKANIDPTTEKDCEKVLARMA